MARADEITWSDVLHSPHTLVTGYHDQFPVYVLVTKGFCGQNEIETISANQMARIDSVVEQKRVLLEDTKGEYFSFPEDFPATFEVKERKKKTKKRTLKEIINKYKLPIPISTDSKAPWRMNLTNKRYSSASIGHLLVVTSYTEKFFRLNTIHDGVIDSKISILPLYIDVKLRVAEGVKGAKVRWRDMVTMYDRAVKHLNIRQLKAPSEVLVFSGDDLKSHFTQTQYKMIMSTLKRPLSKDNKVGQAGTDVKANGSRFLRIQNGNLANGKLPMTSATQTDDEGSMLTDEGANYGPGIRRNILKHGRTRVVSDSSQLSSPRQSRPVRISSNIPPDGYFSDNDIRHDPRQLRTRVYSSTGDLWGGGMQHGKPTRANEDTQQRWRMQRLRSSSMSRLGHTRHYGSTFRAGTQQDRDFGMYGDTERATKFRRRNTSSLYRKRSEGPLTPDSVFSDDGGRKATIIKLRDKVEDSWGYGTVDQHATGVALSLHTLPTANKSQETFHSDASPMLSIPLGGSQDINITTLQRPRDSTMSVSTDIKLDHKGPVLTQGRSHVAPAENEELLHIEIQGADKEWTLKQQKVQKSPSVQSSVTSVYVGNDEEEPVYQKDSLKHGTSVVGSGVISTKTDGLSNSYYMMNDSNDSLYRGKVTIPNLGIQVSKPQTQRRPNTEREVLNVDKSRPNNWESHNADEQDPTPAHEDFIDAGRFQQLNAQPTSNFEHSPNYDDVQERSRQTTASHNYDAPENPGRHTSSKVTTKHEHHTAETQMREPNTSTWESSHAERVSRQPQNSSTNTYQTTERVAHDSMREPNISSWESSHTERLSRQPAKSSTNTYETTEIIAHDSGISSRKSYDTTKRISRQPTTKKIYETSETFSREPVISARESHFTSDRVSRQPVSTYNQRDSADNSWRQSTGGEIIMRKEISSHTELVPIVPSDARLSTHIASQNYMIDNILNRSSHTTGYDYGRSQTSGYSHISDRWSYQPSQQRYHNRNHSPTRSPTRMNSTTGGFSYQSGFSGSNYQSGFGGSGYTAGYLPPGAMYDEVGQIIDDQQLSPGLDKFPDYVPDGQQARDIHISYADSINSDNSGTLTPVNEVEENVNELETESNVFGMERTGETKSQEGKEGEHVQVISMDDSPRTNYDSPESQRQETSEMFVFRDSTGMSYDTNISSLLATSKAEAMKELDRMTGSNQNLNEELQLTTTEVTVESGVTNQDDNNNITVKQPTNISQATVIGGSDGESDDGASSDSSDEAAGSYELADGLPGTESKHLEPEHITVRTNVEVHRETKQPAVEETAKTETRSSSFTMRSSTNEVRKTNSFTKPASPINLSPGDVIYQSAESSRDPSRGIRNAVVRANSKGPADQKAHVQDELKAILRLRSGGLEEGDEPVQTTTQSSTTETARTIHTTSAAGAATSKVGTALRIERSDLDNERSQKGQQEKENVVSRTSTTRSAGSQNAAGRTSQSSTAKSSSRTITTAGDSEVNADSAVTSGSVSSLRQVYKTPPSSLRQKKSLSTTKSSDIFADAPTAGSSSTSSLTKSSRSGSSGAGKFQMRYKEGGSTGKPYTIETRTTTVTKDINQNSSKPLDQDLSLPASEEIHMHHIDSITDLDNFLKTQSEDTISQSSYSSSKLEHFNFGLAPAHNTQF